MFESMEERRFAGARRAPTPAAVPAAASVVGLAVESGHQVVERLLAGLPSARGGLELDALDLDALDDHDRVSALMLWERQRHWLDARQQQALIAVGGLSPRSGDPRDDWAEEEVACALGVASSTAGDRLQVARQLCGRLHRTRSAMAAGQLGYQHARALADALELHPDTVAAHVEQAALSGGPARETLPNFRRRVERALIAADPSSADERHQSACRTRRVVSWPEPDGMASIQATLTADEAATAMRALTALAHHQRADGDRRPIDLLRADAFTQVFAAALANPDLPTAHRARPWIGVTLDYATLVGLADNPGHLDGYGPIPPAMARRIAAGGDWHRLITDPVTGALLDYGTSTYRPPAELAEFVITRDRTCRFPTCNRPARLSDIDHARPWEQNGTTSAHNCGGLCRRNHRQKTSGGWALHSHPDGAATFTGPTGHTYHRQAIDHCPEHTAYLAKLRETEGDPPDLWDPDATNPTDNEEPAAAETEHGRATGRAPATTVDEPEPDTSSGNDPPPF